MGFSEWWDQLMNLGLVPGVHRYDGQNELKGHRFHLRVDTQEKGVLLIDASKIIFLNGTALDLVRCLLEGMTDLEMIDYMNRRYRKAEKRVLIKHYNDIREQLHAASHGNLNALQMIGSESPSIGADDLPAPYRMDLALTYKCNNDCGHCYNEESRKGKEELLLSQWLQVIDKLWDLGIPHVVFTGGEPTLFKNLRDLVIRSELHGQITGMITNGRALSKPGFLKDLVAVGLDHVQITVLSHKETVHDKLAGCEGAWKETINGLKVALKEDLYVNTNTTIMKTNAPEMEETMRFLLGLGVKNIAFNAIIRSGKGKEAEALTCEELTPLITKLKAIGDEAGINLIWYTPTPYCELNPINLGLGIKQCTACSINMAIEPDGTVLPCQSCYEPVGNILTDKWDKIWNHKLCKKIRTRKYIPDKCQDCELLNVCGAGCPLSLEHGDYMCTDKSGSM